MNFSPEEKSSAKEASKKNKSGACPDLFFDYNFWTPLGSKRKLVDDFDAHRAGGTSDDFDGAVEVDGV